MKRNVTFQSSVAVDLAKHPPGEELVDYLRNGLLGAGLSVGKVDHYEDFAWSLDVSVTDHNLFFVVGYVGDGVYEWLLQIHPYVSLRDVFRRKQISQHCDSLALMLHRVLADDAHFAHIRWHQGDFAEGDYTDRPDA